MAKGSIIKSVYARQIFSDRGHPGVETTIVTENDSVGVAIATAGVSVGIWEVQFAYDGGDRWNGRGVLKAVKNIEEIIAPAIIGMDTTQQGKIDDVMIKLDGTPNKANLGGNTTASVSAAVLKAGAASLGLPLYQHIGGVNACILPTPAVISLLGSARYGGGQRSGGKPSYSFVCHGYNTYSEAHYACFEVNRAWNRLLRDKLEINLSGSAFNRPLVQAGKVKHESELWDLMVEAINQSGNEGKIGIQVDVAAGTYWEKDKQKFVGLFSPEDKTRAELIAMYHEMVKKYPFLIIEDPLDEIDYEGHAILAKDLGVQVVGDDLFTTNVERLQEGMKVGACNTVLLKVNQIGTISEAFDTVRLAYLNNYAVMPCSSRGEGADIADYSVGLGTGTIRESGLDSTANRLLQIETDLGERAVFLGRAGLKP